MVGKKKNKPSVAAILPSIKGNTAERGISPGNLRVRRLMQHRTEQKQGVKDIEDMANSLVPFQNLFPPGW